MIHQNKNPAEKKLAGFYSLVIHADIMFKISVFQCCKKFRTQMALIEWISADYICNRFCGPTGINFSVYNASLIYRKLI